MIRTRCRKSGSGEVTIQLFRREHCTPLKKSFSWSATPHIGKNFHQTLRCRQNRRGRHEKVPLVHQYQTSRYASQVFVSWYDSELPPLNLDSSFIKRTPIKEYPLSRSPQCTKSYVSCRQESKLFDQCDCVVGEICYYLLS